MPRLAKNSCAGRNSLVEFPFRKFRPQPHLVDIWFQGYKPAEKLSKPLAKIYGLEKVRKLAAGNSAQDFADGFLTRDASVDT
jgi:hypothetical protein